MRTAGIHGPLAGKETVGSRAGHGSGLVKKQQRRVFHFVLGDQAAEVVTAGETPFLTPISSVTP